MADEAVLTIRFKDESSAGGSPGGVAAQTGGAAAQSTVADQQQAYAAAGGVGAFTARNSGAAAAGDLQLPMLPVPPAAALPVPPVGMLGQPAGGDPLLKAATGIVQADPSATVAELAKALGIPNARAQQLLNAATVQPGGVTGQPPLANWPAQALPVPPTGMLPVPPISQPSTQPAIAPQPPPFVQPPPVVGQQPPPFVQPPPVVNQPGGQGQPSNDAARGVQATVSAIAGLAAQGGPIGAAAGQAASAASALPGVASSIGAALPAAAAAAPYIAAATAALAVPATGMLVLNSIANTARGQIGGLSAELAGAEAQSQVRQLVANMRTSRVLGDELADRERLGSRMSAALQGIRDNVSEQPLKDMNAVMAVFTKAAEAFDKVLDANKEPAQDAVSAAIRKMLPWGARQGWDALVKAGHIFQAAEQKPEPVGLAGVIPKRPELPPPFTNGGNSDRGPKHGIPGLSLFGF